MSTFEFHTSYSAVTGEYVGGYVPDVEADEENDILVDGVPLASSAWSAITGETRQYGYRGAVMHPSETADDDAVREWVRDAGGNQFAIVEVSGCEHDDALYCQEYGCPTPPAGWAIIYQPAE